MTRDFIGHEPIEEAAGTLKTFGPKTSKDAVMYLKASQLDGEDFVPKIEAYLAKNGDENWQEATLRLVRGNDDEFKVFCHSDSWINNILFE